MRPARFIAIALVAVLPIVFLAATAPAAATPAAALLPGFEPSDPGFKPDDREKLAQLGKQLKRMQIELKKLARAAHAAKQQGRTDEARAAARRLAKGKQRYQALENQARMLKARLHQAKRAPKARRPIRARTQRKPAAAPQTVRKTVREVHPRYALAATRQLAAWTHARQAMAARATPARPSADRYVRAEAGYRARMHQLLKEKGELEKKLKAIHEGLSKAKNGLAAIQRAKAARVRAAAQPGARLPAHAASHGNEVLTELRLLRRDVHQLTQAMRAFLALTHKVHGTDLKAAGKQRVKAKQAKAKQAPRNIRRAQKKRSQETKNKVRRRAVTYDDRLSL